jgi:hypothetical protein
MLSVDLLKNKFAILVHVVCPLFIGLAIYYFASSIAFTYFIKNHLADGLWAYAFVSAILLIWERQVNWFWIGIVVLVAFLFECFQFLRIIPGTGDIFDFIVYLSFILFRLLNNYIILKLK